MDLLRESGLSWKVTLSSLSLALKIKTKILAAARQIEKVMTFCLSPPPSSPKRNSLAPDASASSQSDFILDSFLPSHVAGGNGKGGDDEIAMMLTVSSEPNNSALNISNKANRPNINSSVKNNVAGDAAAASFIKGRGLATPLPSSPSTLLLNKELHRQNNSSATSLKRKLDFACADLFHPSESSSLAVSLDSEGSIMVEDKQQLVKKKSSKKSKFSALPSSIDLPASECSVNGKDNTVTKSGKTEPRKPRHKKSKRVVWWELSTFASSDFDPNRLTERQQMAFMLRKSELESENGLGSSDKILEISPFVLDKLEIQNDPKKSVKSSSSNNHGSSTDDRKKRQSVEKQTPGSSSKTSASSRKRNCSGIQNGGNENQENLTLNVSAPIVAPVSLHDADAESSVDIVAVESLNDIVAIESSVVDNVAAMESFDENAVAIESFVENIAAIESAMHSESSLDDTDGSLVSENVTDITDDLTKPVSSLKDNSSVCIDSAPAPMTAQSELSVEEAKETADIEKQEPAIIAKEAREILIKVLEI